MQYLHMVPQKSGAGIFDNLISYPILRPIKSKNVILRHFLTFSATSAARNGQKNENKEKCRTTFLGKSIKSNYNKNEVFSTNTETPIFFSQNLS